MANDIDGYDGTVGEVKEKRTPSAVLTYPHYPVVALGASAGGLEPLEAFLHAVPKDCAMAFVVVTHLDPKHESHLAEILQKSTSMPVTQIRNGVKVAANHVYVNPPGQLLSIIGGTLQFSERTHPSISHLPIDTFFKSLANDCGANAVGIVLSGSGTDGTVGLREIKAEGGTTMVQDPRSAKYDGMPQSAAATGLIDYVMPPHKMPAKLINFLGRSIRKIATGSPLLKPENEKNLQSIFFILKEKTGRDFSNYKKNTIYRRLERRMGVHQITGLADYLSVLRDSEQEVHILLKELLIGVTNFFRDPEAFESLKTQLKLYLNEKPDDYTIRVWIPGCSHGQEAFSIAITLYECAEELGRSFGFQIFATDIDEAAIDNARHGIYPPSIKADISTTRLKRFFRLDSDGQYRIKKVIREMVVFAVQDVIKDPPFTKLDLLSCRNVLIYLGTDLQRKLHSHFHYSLKPEGLLLLGSSESIGRTIDFFKVLDRKWKIFKRKPSSEIKGLIETLPKNQAKNRRSKSSVDEKTKKRSKGSNMIEIELVEKILEQSGTPPCIVIDDAYNLIYVHGHTGRYLEPAQGQVSVNVLDMARTGLKKDLIAVVGRVMAERHEVIQRNVKIKNGDDEIYLDLVAKPISGRGPMRTMILVIFQEIIDPFEREKRTNVEKPKRGRKTVAQLEKELQSAKDVLQQTIEELETSNEKLRSTNEELQSTNEELQSANEELETSKEELQSLNEESSTVNAELQSRVDELSKANDDMRNLLDNTDIATIFLDTELNVRRSTPAASSIIPLTSVDSGRPINHFASSLVDVDLAAISEQVLNTLKIIELAVVTKDDKCYQMRLRPYRTTANVIDGVVITFQDTTQHKALENALHISDQKVREREALITLLCDHVADSIFIVSESDGKILYFNPPAYQRLGYTENEFHQLTLHDIDPNWDSKLKDLKSGESVQATHQHKKGDSLPVHIVCENLEFDRVHCLFVRCSYPAT